jgi:hypothetical protein
VATRAAAAAALISERMFFGGMALAMLAFVFVGFAPTYYLQGYFGVVSVRGSAPLTPLVHAHAVVTTAWMLLFAAQAGLIAVRRPDLHRIAGIGGLLLAAAVAAIGAVTAIESARLGRTPPGWSTEGFLVFPLASVALMTLFVGLGALNRHRPQHHKRLMLLAAIAMLVPAGARMARYVFTGVLPPGPVGGMLLSDVFLVALALNDIRRGGRLHPVTLWGGGVLLASQPLRVYLAETTPWRDFAAFLIG